LCGLGDVAGDLLGGGALDDTDGDGLPHVTDSETSERREVGEGFHAHGLGGDQLDDGGIARLDGLGIGFDGLTSTTINLFLNFVEFASNVSGVAIQDRRVAVANLSGMVQDNDLSGEVLASKSRLVLGVRSDITTLDVLDGNVLDVETNVVSGSGLREGFVVHLNGLNLSGQVVRSKGNDHAGFDDTSFDTTNGHSSNTTDFVNVLEGAISRVCR